MIVRTGKEAARRKPAAPRQILVLVSPRHPALRLLKRRDAQDHHIKLTVCCREPQPEQFSFSRNWVFPELVYCSLNASFQRLIRRARLT